MNRQHLLSFQTCERRNSNSYNSRTRGFTIPNPIFPGNVPTVNLPSSGEEVSPHISMVGQPKNHISDLQFEKIPKACNHPVWEDEFHNRSVFWFQLPCGINAVEKVEMATFAHDLETSR